MYGFIHKQLYITTLSTYVIYRTQSYRYLPDFVSLIIPRYEAWAVVPRSFCVIILPLISLLPRLDSWIFSQQGIRCDQPHANRSRKWLPHFAGKRLTRSVLYAEFLYHYSDVIVGAMVSQKTSLAIVYSTVYSGTDEKKIKASRHWPLCGEFTGDRWIPTQMVSNAENVSIGWRHHGQAWCSSPSSYRWLNTRLWCYRNFAIKIDIIARTS